MLYYFILNYIDRSKKRIMDSQHPNNTVLNSIENGQAQSLKNRIKKKLQKLANPETPILLNMKYSFMSISLGSLIQKLVNNYIYPGYGYGAYYFFNLRNLRLFATLPIKDHIRQTYFSHNNIQEPLEQLYNKKQPNLRSTFANNFAVGCIIGFISQITLIKIRDVQSLLAAEDVQFARKRLRKYYKDNDKSIFAYWKESMQRKNNGFMARLVGTTLYWGILLGLFDTVQMSLNKKHQWIRLWIMPNILFAGFCRQISLILTLPFDFLNRLKVSQYSKVYKYKDWEMQFIFGRKSYMTLLTQKSQHKNRIIDSIRQVHKPNKLIVTYLRYSCLQFGTKLALYEFLKHHYLSLYKDKVY